MDAQILSRWAKAIDRFQPTRIDHCTTTVWHAEDKLSLNLLLATGDHRSKDYYDTLEEFTIACLYLYLEEEHVQTPDTFQTFLRSVEPQPVEARVFYPSLRECLGTLGITAYSPETTEPQQTCSLYHKDRLLGMTTETEDSYAAFFWNAER